MATIIIAKPVQQRTTEPRVPMISPPDVKQEIGHIENIWNTAANIVVIIGKDLIKWADSDSGDGGSRLKKIRNSFKSKETPENSANEQVCDTADNKRVFTVMDKQTDIAYSSFTAYSANRLELYNESNKYLNSYYVV